MKCFVWIKRIQWLNFRTEARPHEMLDYKLTKSMDTFSFYRSPDLEETRWFQCVTSLDVQSLLFVLSKHNKRTAFIYQGMRKALDPLKSKVFE